MTNNAWIKRGCLHLTRKGKDKQEKPVRRRVKRSLGENVQN